MSYDRVVDVGGKSYGLYTYKSVRVGKKVKSVYLGKKVSKWIKFKDWFKYPDRCNYWRVCKNYRENSHTCNKNEGFYGENLANCYKKR